VEHASLFPTSSDLQKTSGLFVDRGDNPIWQKVNAVGQQHRRCGHVEEEQQLGLWDQRLVLPTERVPSLNFCNNAGFEQGRTTASSPEQKIAVAAEEKQKKETEELKNAEETLQAYRM
jgi:hypothetical protein